MNGWGGARVFQWVPTQGAGERAEQRTATQRGVGLKTMPPHGPVIRMERYARVQVLSVNCN